MSPVFRKYKSFSGHIIVELTDDHRGTVIESSNGIYEVGRFSDSWANLMIPSYGKM